MNKNILSFADDASVIAGFADVKLTQEVLPFFSLSVECRQWLVQQIFICQYEWCKKWGLPLPNSEEIYVVDASNTVMNATNKIPERWHVLRNSQHDTAELCNVTEYLQWGVVEGGSMVSGQATGSMASDVVRASRLLQEAILGLELLSTSESEGGLARQLGGMAFNAWKDAFWNLFDLDADESLLQPSIVSLDAPLILAVPAGDSFLYIRLLGCLVHSFIDRHAPSLASDPIRNSDSISMAVVRLDEAMATQEIALTVQLRSVTLSVGELYSLQKDDVILLPHALDQSLRMYAPDGACLGEAWLGTFQESVAVRLKALDAEI